MISNRQKVLSTVLVTLFFLLSLYGTAYAKNQDPPPLVPSPPANKPPLVRITDYPSDASPILITSDGIFVCFGSGLLNTPMFVSYLSNDNKTFLSQKLVDDFVDQPYIPWGFAYQAGGKNKIVNLLFWWQHATISLYKYPLDGFASPWGNYAVYYDLSLKRIVANYWNNWPNNRHYTQQKIIGRFPDGELYGTTPYGNITVGHLTLAVAIFDNPDIGVYYPVITSFSVTS